MAEASAVAVCVRVRPLNSREEALGEDSQIYWKTGKNAIYQVDGSKSFSFDRVFGSDESTKNVYEEIAVPIIDSAIQGYNGTIFAYGQTASGKTYTMMGSKDYLGVIPRAIHDIFQKIQKFPDREFLLRVSYMEIYNETITDLLCDTQKMKPLVIREDYSRNVYVSDLTEEVVYTSDMALKWITKGEKNRHYGTTKMNQRSSRSHTIFRMILESREKGDPSSCEGAVKVSHLNLVDLAGSERAAQTGAEGVRLKEGCNINRSLFILGQVIKKLSDEQAGGFINYRDSKLTRILQNSLGGNAKTRIICTITPVSFDETLSTLQFASTAKYMKNTPYVNEVSSDEALLKRYRKEITDLKKQLEEVSLETRAQAMEKDQLAQLLEEKDLLQKVQIEKIQNLTRMLVTSSSLTSQQELKAKKKRRVTWCVGKINKEKAKFVEEFSVPANVTTKTNRSVLSSVGEMDESLYSEADVFSNTLDTLSEIEWNPATKLLASDSLESELRSLRVDYDNLVLDHERLRRENLEMETKLKEKDDLDEFEALERKAEKDHEMQLIHEISNLKNLVKHAEVYNQDLEDELTSKAALLREKEEQIQQLQKSLARQKPDTSTLDLSYSSETAGDMQQLRQSLLDAETVALDSKRESAFLRGENRELHEKLRELESRCGQVESELQSSQRQVEARKKMQADLEKELQASFSEVAKLSALLDGKVPRDVLSTLELERKISDLQRELKKEVEEKAALQKEVQSLTELKSLPSEVEALRKEVHEKSEELSLLTAERDKMLSGRVGQESGAQDLPGETGTTGDDPTAAQEDCRGTSEARLDPEGPRAEDKFQALLEEKARVDAQVSALTLNLATLETELSQKTRELQQKAAESEAQRDDRQQLQEQLESHASRLQAAEDDRTRAAQLLEQALADVRALTQEKDALRESQASLQAERDQLRCDIQDTVHMNIDTQEQLRDALESLKQSQETISALRRRLDAETPGDQAREECPKGPQGDCPEQPSGGDERPPEARAAPGLAGVAEDEESRRKILTLTQEKEELQQRLEHVRAESEQLRLDLQENVEMTIENQEELRTLREALKRQQEAAAQAQAEDRDALASAEDRMKEMSRQLQAQEQQLAQAREELDAARSVKQELQSQVAALQLLEAEKRELARELDGDPREGSGLQAGQAPEAAAPGSSRQPREPQDVEEAAVGAQERPRSPEPLTDSAQEASGTRAVLREPEPRGGPPESPAALVPASTEVEQPDWARDIQACRQEIEALREERDQLRGARDTLEAERDRLREDLGRRAAQSEWESPSIKRVDSGGQEVETQPWAGGDGALLVQVGAPRGLQEHTREGLAKHQEAEQELAMARGQLRAQESTIEELQAALRDTEAQASRIQQELDTAREDFQRQIQELTENQKQLGVDESETPRDAGELGRLRELVAARDASLQSSEQEKLRLLERLEGDRAEMDELRGAQAALLAERDQLAASLRAAEAQLEQEHSAGLEDVQLVQRQLEAQRAALASAEVEKAGLAQRLQEREEEAAAVTRERDGLSTRLQEAEACVREQQEALDEARGRLQERQEALEAMQSLQTLISERDGQLASMRAELETTSAALQTQTLQLQEKEQDLHEATRGLGESGIRAEQLERQLREMREEVARVSAQRDALEEAERTTRAQLEEHRRVAGIQAREQQEELEAARGRLQEQLGTVQTLRGLGSEREEELASARAELETTRAKLQEKSQELRASERQLCQLWEDVGQMEKQLAETQRLRKQLQTQGLTLDKLELENLNLAQQLHDSQREGQALARERDGLRRAEETLRQEQEQLQEQLRTSAARHLKAQQELTAAHAHLKEHQETIQRLQERVSEKASQIAHIQEGFRKSEDELQRKDPPDHQEGTPRGDGKQPLTKSLREKCSRIRELAKKYAELHGRYECLDRLAEGLERDIGTQKELSARVKTQLPLPYAQARQVDKALTTSLRGFLELLRVMKKLKYVLSHVTKIKEEQHVAINKFEMAFIEELDKQDELLLQAQRLRQDHTEPPGGSRDLKLSQNMDLHLEELVRDLSESDFHSVKAEIEALLDAHKETLRLLGDWLDTRFDVDTLRDGLQKANQRICAGNNLYNSRILTILNESTEFEEKTAALTSQWEQDLRAMREKREALWQDCQALARAQPPPAPRSPEPAPEEKQRPLQATAVRRSSEHVRELEASLREARDTVQQKDSRLARMQKELEASQGSVAALQGQVSELKDSLEKAQGTVQALQDKVALGAEPYREEIEDLKTKLVRRDLEMLTDNKELKKELTSSRATVEHQKELIRVLRESLRRTQQTHDASIIAEPASAPPPRKPLTCGGGSGIVQSTKALILRNEYARLEKENCRLKQQNERLTKQKDELVSSNQHLCSEVQAWKERTLGREAPRGSPCQRALKSPKGPPSRRRPHAPTPSPTRFREHNAGPPEPQRGSPGGWFLDSRCKSLPSPRPAGYFDNSSLGLPGPISTEEAKDPNTHPGPWLTESSVDVPECKTQ